MSASPCGDEAGWGAVGRGIRCGCVAALIVACQVAVARAQVPQAPPDQGSANATRLAPEAEVFADYTSGGERGAGLSRVSLSIAGKLSERLSVRLTPDLVHRDDADGVPVRDTVRLRQAYVDIGLASLTGRWTQSWIRIGMQPTPLIDFEERVYRYRFQGPTFAERSGVALDAERGVTLHANFPHGYGDVQAGVFDGHGYRDPEPVVPASVQVRATLRPFPSRLIARGLRLTAFVDTRPRAALTPRRPTMVTATFEHAHLVAGADYLPQGASSAVGEMAPLRHGWSIWTTPIVHQKGRGLEGLLRHDVEFESGEFTGTRTRTVAGVAYWWRRDDDNRGAAILVDVERTRLGTTIDRRLAVHTRLTF